MTRLTALERRTLGGAAVFSALYIVFLVLMLKGTI
jgi:hypothetical protein